MATAPELTRRSLLAIVAGLATAFRVLAQTPSWLAGLQLWTIRDALGADVDAALRAVADVGYREVELAGLAGLTPAAMHQHLRRYRLGAPSMHADYNELRRDRDSVLKEAATLGATYLVVPSIDLDQRRTEDDWKRVCGTLGRVGRAVRSNGVTLAYHNHDYEFVPYRGGAAPFDLLVRETDPGDLKLEVDVYWVARGGRDPVRCLQDNAGRVSLVHLKDLGRDGSAVELGAGVLAMEPIVRAALMAGAKHIFVEQDEPADPLRSIRTSLRFLESLPAAVRPRTSG
jgi:sugar phosphate isomerase/epimerase